MTRSFTVARHTFHLTMDSSNRLWEHLESYEPFVSEPSEDPLFTMDVVPEAARPEAGLIFSDCPEEGQPKIDLYHGEQGWIIDIAPLPGRPICCALLCSDDFRKVTAVIPGQNPAGLTGLTNALMLVYAFSSAPFDTLEVHASVTVNSGKSYLFLGKSGTGKSTHSSLWLKYIEGSELLNDDNPILRLDDNGKLICYGSPWSGKTPCYKNASAPVGAIVRIKQAPYNKIRRLSVIESYASMFSSCSGFKADRTIADGMHASLEKIAVEIPLYELECLPDEEAARVCSAKVIK